METGAGLPPVTAGAAADALADLPPRLRKRLDGAVAKAAGWPATRAEGTVRVAVDADTTVVLTLTAHGTVARAAAVSCDCLLAPACLHRAAVLAAAPLAEEEDDEEGAPAEEGEPAREPAPGSESGSGTDPRTAPGPHPAPDFHGHGHAPGSGSGPDTPQAPASVPRPPHTPPPSAPPPPDPAARQAARALWAAGVAALREGAVASTLPRTGLLHATRSARLAGLHRPSAAAVRVARRLGEARAAEPSFRLAALVDDLAELLDLARTVRDADPDDAAARSAAHRAAGEARRTYRPSGSLRLYGLFTEPVVTASGYAGARTFALETGGALRTVAVVAPGPPDRARQAAGARVPGGAALSLRELGRGAGLLATGATLTEDGRIGGGAALRTVTAAGADWSADPLDALWRPAPAQQVRTALAHHATDADRRPAGSDLLFLEGTVAERGGRPVLLPDDGPPVPLHAPDERPELAYADNLRRLAERPGGRVRLIGRLAPDRPSGVDALALATAAGDRYDLGLDRLPPGPPGADGRAALPADAPLAPPPVEWELLSRAVARTVAGGRAVAAAAVDPELPGRLVAAGLPTAAACARALAAATRARRPDPLGAMLPADPDAFATAWLAAALYTGAAAREFTATAWAGRTSLSV
ncbi:hypothetical protein RVR_2979 [Actinacidiphila reveromycinica]|uniref:SWIM-type domain-containing protein n=1 Tax=Actinacidiphila reveromycinica TaxID=659352 RepID=A0A7U3VN50_9ACTN|nr:hypothetical protein [Streptomyces sp. SN-593]BBA97303.1 hypothetical protein RVR_2979 [Streptomyces sp. SN-593]